MGIGVVGLYLVARDDVEEFVGASRRDTDGDRQGDLYGGAKTVQQSTECGRSSRQILGGCDALSWITTEYY